MGRKTLLRSIVYELSTKMRIGESRHEAKKALKAEMGDDYRFGMTVPGIHGYGSRDTYQYDCKRFGRWCVEQRGASRYARVEDVKHLAIPYLQYRKDSGMSLATLKKERSALRKLYGESVNFPLPKRTPDQITRSRGPVEMDKHFSEEKNKDLITMVTATGCRRGDIGRSRAGDYREAGGIPVVDIFKSKGGRNRTAPILPGMEKEVKDIVDAVKTAGREQIFDHIHTKADIHSYRREYAQTLYKAVSSDPVYRAKVLALYPLRRENVKSDSYTTRRKDIPNRTFLRDDLYAVSQALGHNRLDVTVNHYLL